jgi:NTE family protein
MGEERSGRKRVALALQGGGSHGAFTWGVLEALLADGRFEIEGLSGTSAGGMNAAATVQGLAGGGDAGAIEALERYWRGVHELSLQIAPLAVDPIGKVIGDPNLRTSPLMLVGSLMKLWLTDLSPYTLNPMNYNPFRGFAEEFFDFELLRSTTRWKLFLAATHVETGKIRIFHNQEITPDALMATTCLPSMFHAVEVDGEFYWDGGFIANPAIFPLINECAAKDIVVVQLTKSRCPHLPQQQAQIMERFSEITFNSCLIREIRAIHFITTLIDAGKITDPAIRRINLHIIKDDATFYGLTSASAANTDWDFLNMLRRAGRKTGERWIQRSFDRLGERLPFDRAIQEEYL